MYYVIFQPDGKNNAGQSLSYLDPQYKDFYDCTLTMSRLDLFNYVETCQEMLGKGSCCQSILRILCNFDFLPINYELQALNTYSTQKQNTKQLIK